MSISRKVKDRLKIALHFYFYFQVLKMTKPYSCWHFLLLIWVHQITFESFVNLWNKIRKFFVKTNLRKCRCFYSNSRFIENGWIILWETMRRSNKRGFWVYFCNIFCSLVQTETLHLETQNLIFLSILSGMQHTELTESILFLLIWLWSTN